MINVDELINIPSTEVNQTEI